MRTRYVRQPIPWSITDGSSYVLPSRGETRWRLAGVCITAPATPPGGVCVIAVQVENGDGTVAGRYEGAADNSTTTTTLTFGSNAPVQTSSPFLVGSLAFLPPDLWVEPWQRVRLSAADSDWPSTVTVVTCECEEQD